DRESFGRHLAARPRRLFRRRRRTRRALPPRTPGGAGRLARGLERGTAPAAPARGGAPLSDGAGRATVAAADEIMGRRGAAPARASRRAPCPPPPRHAGRAASAAGALALAPCPADRRARGIARQGRCAGRRPAVRREAARIPPAAGGIVGEPGRGGGLIPR